MSGWDDGQLFFSAPQVVTDERGSVQDYLVKFKEFLRTFERENEEDYRDRLRKDKTTLEVNLDDLTAFDEDLARALRTEPGHLVPLLERAAKEVLFSTLVPRPESVEDVADVQVTLTSSANPMHLRSLTAHHISELVEISGIIISASKARAKASRVTVICRNCKFTKTLPVRPGFGGVQIPRTCEGQQIGAGQPACPLDPFQILAERCEYSDQQTLKLQELPENVPTSEMPRHILLSSDGTLVEKAVPGMRIVVIGVYSIFQSNSKKQTGAVAIRTPYIRVLGIKVEAGGVGRAAYEFTQAEHAEFRQLAGDPKIYEAVANSIAPSIFGHADIKKAVACLLMGGSRKLLPDGMRLRGDINVLLLGDPSTAKSQMLKFVEKVAPICVYTSGKGSSAAGLTACVVKDPSTGEFYLEGGAMVLADGGVVCIDEFDKMREEDRVAIHEAMEQQTISIAKAGITTILNSRTSVLAAANPQFGRYDDMKSAVENIDFQSTILSRFDLIFIIKDTRDETRDKTVASHVLALHLNAKDPTAEEAAEGQLDIGVLRRYIAFCRSKASPRMSEDAAVALSNHFVKIRSDARERGKDAVGAIPITIRQLEAIVRISEALAKFQLMDVATADHVNEALRLFKVSTLDAAASGIIGESGSPELIAKVKDVEQFLGNRLAVGTSVPESKVIHVRNLCVSALTASQELRERQVPDIAIRKALSVLLMRQEIEYRANGKLIFRKR